MPTLRPQTWFEMPELRRRNFADAVWVPLRAAETIEGPRQEEELFCCGAIAFPPNKRDEAETLGWSDLGLMHDGGPYAFRNHPYKPAEVYQRNEGEDLGIEMVFEQHPGGEQPAIWHLNQDLVLALNIVQEGDSWIRPREGFVEVAKQRRNKEGRVIAIEIKREFLRDYLSARGLALRLAYYRQRKAIESDCSHIAWRDEGICDEQPHHRFKANVFEVDETGGAYGATMAVFEVWRTDIDVDADVPIFGPETDTNTDSRSRHFKRQGEKFYRIEGELWREEWIESGERSERVRGDDPVEGQYYIIDAAGTRESHTALNDEDIGRWLWFDPRVVPAILSRRGGELGWYTQYTGYVSISHGYRTHFGLNRSGLITVYAYDIAKLPIWQQRIWAGHNITPEDAVSSELLASQMRAKPANTTSAEEALPSLLNGLDHLTIRWLGTPLFQSHDATDSILSRIHRFRALEHEGVLALAKDITRLTADRIDKALLKNVIQPPKNENWGSLKFLENALATICSPEEAHSLLTPIVGIYDLRLADAHLPSKTLSDAYGLVGLDTTSPPLAQGQQLLEVAVSAWERIGDVIYDTLKKCTTA